MPKWVRCSMQPRVVVTCLDNPTCKYTFQFYQTMPTKKMLNEAIGLWADLYCVDYYVVKYLRQIVDSVAELHDGQAEEVEVAHESGSPVPAKRYRLQVLGHALVFEQKGEGKLLEEKDALPEEI